MTPRTITIDGAELNEVRIFVDSLGKTAVQLSYTLLSGTTVVQRVSLQEFTGQLQAGELTAAGAFLSMMKAALERVQV